MTRVLTRLELPVMPRVGRSTLPMCAQIRCGLAMGCGCRTHPTQARTGRARTAPPRFGRQPAPRIRRRPGRSWPARRIGATTDDACPAMTTPRTARECKHPQSVTPTPDPVEARCGSRPLTRAPRKPRGGARTPPRPPQWVAILLRARSHARRTPQHPSDPRATPLVLNNQYLYVTFCPWLGGHMVEPEQWLHERSGVPLSGHRVEPEFDPVMKGGGHASDRPRTLAGSRARRRIHRPLTRVRGLPDVRTSSRGFGLVADSIKWCRVFSEDMYDHVFSDGRAVYSRVMNERWLHVLFGCEEPNVFMVIVADCRP